MKVYHLSSAPFNGGAARAGYRLHQGLLNEPNVESFWVDADRSVRATNAIQMPAPSRGQSFKQRFARKRWDRVLAKLFRGTSVPSSNPIGWATPEVIEQLPTPDIWNLHWVSWFLNWETMLPVMAERAPIVWTLHDLNTMQGAWHYVPEPEERTSERMKWEQRAIDLKTRALRKLPRNRLTFVGPSKWMVESCRNSPITGRFDVYHIPYGIDTDQYRPQPMGLFRRLLEIPDDLFVIGFLAANLNDPRKGMKPFQQSLNQLAKTKLPIHLVTVGSGGIDSGGLPHTHLGSLQGDRLLANFYSACDVFVCPSLQDNLPNTVIESMACGTPVVAFDVGGLPDMVRENESGILVKKVADPDSLVKALLELIDARKNLIGVRERCKEISNSEYALNIPARRYVDLYNSST